MPTRLDAPTTSHLSADQLDGLRRRLTDERAAQEARAAELRDSADLEPDLVTVLLARCHDAIEDIDAAVSRLGAGSYGSCVACGAAIPFERLEIVPAADRCVACRSERSDPGR